MVSPIKFNFHDFSAPSPFAANTFWRKQEFLGAGMWAAGGIGGTGIRIANGEQSSGNGSKGNGGKYPGGIGGTGITARWMGIQTAGGGMGGTGAPHALLAQLKSFTPSLQGAAPHLDATTAAADLHQRLNEVAVINNAWARLNLSFV